MSTSIFLEGKNVKGGHQVTLHVSDLSITFSLDKNWQVLEITDGTEVMPPPAPAELQQFKVTINPDEGVPVEDPAFVVTAVRATPPAGAVRAALVTKCPPHTCLIVYGNPPRYYCLPC